MALYDLAACDISALRLLCLQEANRLGTLAETYDLVTDDQALSAELRESLRRDEDATRLRLAAQAEDLSQLAQSLLMPAVAADVDDLRRLRQLLEAGATEQVYQVLDDLIGARDARGV